VHIGATIVIREACEVFSGLDDDEADDFLDEDCIFEVR
jgi:hypothetical protein